LCCAVKLIRVAKWLHFLGELLAKNDKITEDEDSSLAESLVNLVNNRQIEFGKILIDKIDVSKLGDNQQFEMLWGIANGRILGGKKSTSFLIFQHMLDKGFNAAAKREVDGGTVVREIASQFGSKHDTDAALIRSILKKIGVVETTSCAGDKFERIQAICDEFAAATSTPAPSVNPQQAASRTASKANQSSYCVVS
jgi:hypothetical protein